MAAVWRADQMAKARATGDGRTGSVVTTGSRWGAPTEQQWDALAAEAFSGMKEWRLQHPKATFVEIERAVDERLTTLRTRMLQDIALASAATRVADTPRIGRPRCPACSEPVEARGTRARSVRVTHGQAVTLTRDYAVCPACGTGLFPPG